MNNFTFIKDYRDISMYRHSLNDLAQRIFGFDFENWYLQGYWCDAYNPYSFADNGKIIANVSVNKMTLVINGIRMHAIQLGTVMTDEAYRNRSLSRELMNIIFSEYEDKADFIYLFANDTVLDFYPKFGFKKTLEYECSTKASGIAQSRRHRKLDLDNAADKAILFRLIENMTPAGKIGCAYNIGIVMFYCSAVYKDHVTYLPELDAAVVAEDTGDVLYIREIFSQNDLDLDILVNALADKPEKKIVFGFTPKCDNNDYHFTAQSDDNDTLFIRSKHPLALPKGMFPLLSHT
jgi:hypothetical protein